MTGASLIRMTASLREIALRLRRDRRGIAAAEFAIIVPLMLTMFFGTVEICSGVAVDRKVTLVARTLSDLTSQSDKVVDSDMTNFFEAGKMILWPYAPEPINATISELYVNPTTQKATVQWSKGSSVRTTGSQVVIPAALATGGTYLIYSEVSYLYVPAVGYIMNKFGVTLKDTNFTRPRQSTCVTYGSVAAPCPTS